MQDYKDDLMYAREEAAGEVADRRYQRIVEEMEKLGWEYSIVQPRTREKRTFPSGRNTCSSRRNLPHAVRPYHLAAGSLFIYFI